MADRKEIRRRRELSPIQTQFQNGHTNNVGKMIGASEFTYRESPLTVLISKSLHIRTIYHIFVVILMMLLLDTVIYDLVDRGKINIGIRAIVNGFGDVSRTIKLWVYLQSVALLLYPGLVAYQIGASYLKNSVLLKSWKFIGVLSVVLLQMALLSVPIWELSREHLAIASSVTVTCEMFRFVMKVHAMVIACASRCHEEKKSLPSFTHYIYFLFAPTLVYRDQYPRTTNIRWSVVALSVLEVAGIIFYNSFLWERFILPNWSDYGKEHVVEAGKLVRNMFSCVLPGVISFLCGFYCLLHVWLNAFAELLTFGDRLFYEEWWVTSEFSRYYRAWNRVVHSWLRVHIHKPLAPVVGRAVSTFFVFLLSAIAHEVILALSFGFFYPVLWIQFGVLGVLMVPLTTGGGKFPSLFNLLMWFSFFLGNGLLWSLYPMEYFARLNCPKSEHDSFFIPKSWSCPKIIMKPNWSFHNPFDLS